MVIRFRRSSGVERQQLKWFAFAVVVLVTYFVISAILEGFGISEGAVGEFISGLAFLGIPVTVGIAILQYRLWDLDVVVKKALVAGALVVLALAVYAGGGRLVRRGGCRPPESRNPVRDRAPARDRVPTRHAHGSQGGRSVRLRQARYSVRGPDGVLRARGDVLRDRGRPASDGPGTRRGRRRGGGARVATGWTRAPPGGRLA